MLRDGGVLDSIFALVAQVSATVKLVSCRAGQVTEMKLDRLWLHLPVASLVDGSW